VVFLPEDSGEVVDSGWTEALREEVKAVSRLLSERNRGSVARYRNVLENCLSRLARC